MIKKILNKAKGLGENDKIVYKNVIGAFCVKGCALFVALFTMPTYIAFFNNDEVLGLWFTILSLLQWILNFDLGIGNGLRNHLSEAISLGKREEAKKLVSSAYFSVAGIVVAISVVFVAVIGRINLNELLNISPQIIPAKTMTLCAIIVFLGVMLQFWLRLINAVLYAMQKSSLNNLIVLVTNILILLVARFYPSGTNEQNIVVMSVVHAVAVALPLVVVTVIVFAGKLRFALPHVKDIGKAHIKRVLSLGGIFFFIQLAYMVIMSSNEFIITKASGNAFNVDYQSYYKIFSIGSMVFALALTPIWSVITKAKAENNYKWIYSTYKKFMLLGALFSVGEFVLVFITKPIMKIWLGDDSPKVELLICLSFAVMGSLMIFNGVLSSIANGTGELKIQAICFGIGAALKIPLSYLLVSLVDAWYGVVIANVVCMGIYTVVQPFFIKKYVSEKYHNILEE